MSMTWLDYIIFAVFIFAVLIGMWRGFVREMIALVIWAVAFAVAIAFSPWLADKLTTTIAEPRLRISLAFMGAFLTVLIIGMFINFLVSRSVSSSDLSMGNRLVGGLFGLIRGGLIIGVLLLLGQALNFNRDDAWQKSQLVPYFVKISDLVGKVVNFQEKRYATGIVLKEGKA